jgi:hypothetical protein
VLVTRHPPFANYASGLVVARLIDQLRHRSNIMLIESKRLAAYAGWIEVDDAQAREWQQHGGPLPEPDWQRGNAIVVTMVVSNERRFLSRLLYAVSQCYPPGVKAYRMRSFTDGRLNRRPPILCRGPQAA